MTLAAITAGKKRRCVSTSQWDGFQSPLCNGLCFIAEIVRLIRLSAIATSTRGMSITSKAH
jgi:hypothetical protein